MRAKLFVGNLPWSVDSVALEEIFRDYADVTSARVITDRETGRSRGFGFVEVEADDINSVITATNGREIAGRPLRVNEAEDRERGGFNRDRGGFGGDRGDRGERSFGGDRGDRGGYRGGGRDNY